LLKSWAQQRAPREEAVPAGPQGSADRAKADDESDRAYRNRGAKTLEHYDHLYAVADGKIQILKDIPGSNASEKMVAVGLLLAYGNLLNASEPTTFDDIRDVCKAHGCLDGTNLSKRLKEQRDAFVFSGTPKSQTLKLTVPGKKRAEQMADSLQAQ
jgi:hypothetical protein